MKKKRRSIWDYLYYLMWILLILYFLKVFSIIPDPPQLSEVFIGAILGYILYRYDDLSRRIGGLGTRVENLEANVKDIVNRLGRIDERLIDLEKALEPQS